MVRLSKREDHLIQKVIENGGMVKVNVKYKEDLQGWEVNVEGKNIEEALGLFYGQDQAYRIADELEERLDDLGLAIKE